MRKLIVKQLIKQLLSSPTLRQRMDGRRCARAGWLIATGRRLVLGLGATTARPEPLVGCTVS